MMVDEKWEFKIISNCQAADSYLSFPFKKELNENI
jgi:hypothetical protein